MWIVQFINPNHCNQFNINLHMRILNPQIAVQFCELHQMDKILQLPTSSPKKRKKPKQLQPESSHGLFNITPTYPPGPTIIWWASSLTQFIIYEFCLPKIAQGALLPEVTGRQALGAFLLPFLQDVCKRIGHILHYHLCFARIILFLPWTWTIISTNLCQNLTQLSHASGIQVTPWKIDT